MPRPTSADLALVRSNLPSKRVAVPTIATNPSRPTFANMLQTASQRPAPIAPTRISYTPTSTGGATAPLSRSQMLDTAQQLMNIPYVWGGNSASGLDCSAFVSKVWGVSRQTTDTLSNVARRISKDELQAGDALNLSTAQDSDGAGHVRLFDKWANPEKTKMWVYEETPPRSVHHIINWDPSYTPMRRLNVTEGSSFS